MRALSIVVAGALIAVATVAAVRSLATGPAPATAAAPPAAPFDARLVASVRLEGDQLPIATLERVLTTRAGARLRDGDLARDRAALVGALVARGHLAARVNRVRTTPGPDGLRIVFTVTAGGAYRVGAVAVDGPLGRRFPALTHVPTMLTGQPWSADRAASNQAMLRAWLARQGVGADVRIDPRIDHARRTVDVRFVVDRT